MLIFVFPNVLFIMEEQLQQLSLYRGISTYKMFTGHKKATVEIFLSPLVRRLCNTTKRTAIQYNSIELRDDTNKTNMWMAAHGDYCSVANLRTKISALHHRIFRTSRAISTSFIYLFTCTTISRWTPNNVLQNPGCKILT